MRLGRITGINFLSKLLGSVIGFAATIYVARILGPGPLGTYHLTIAIVSWLAIVARLGFSEAISKRVSEGEDQGEYAVAGISIIAIIYLSLVCLLYLFRTQVNSYVGYQATSYIALLLLVILSFAIISALLRGIHLVHIYSILSTLKTGARSSLQIVLVFAGFKTAGLFIGHIVGVALIIGVGLYFVFKGVPRPSFPNKGHFDDLIDFAKYSWLGGIRGRIFNYTDIIILGYFVSPALVGIYSVAWSISKFLRIFSSSLQSTIFPEISKLSTAGESGEISQIVEQSLTYSGLILIPGFLGGVLLNERILMIYGQKFQQGASVLVILIIANLIQGYQNQFLNTLNGVDRPNLAFKVNAIFIVSNISLNIILIYIYGWIGAAIATASSAVVSLFFGYYYSASLLNFDIPYEEIAKQFFSAIIMAVLIYTLIVFENKHSLLAQGFTTTLLLVLLGAGIYFLTLLIISNKFREVAYRNLPFNF